ncbi:hypothetical protein [Mucilaginibacter flavus]|uniref:hypothetical protein n=1 Tax=Mucilaginibacter flavus TaxID=931504 RepID=UPI0025B4F213|nr:hypothetical protein [Mucilaginibacter flavus]MDN3581184.1 hypothetical protein [Mucilaginibacter flavus]
MDNREWLDDYTSLKQVNANNPFMVPSAYFDELAQHITSRIRLEELKNSSTGFNVPENYFEQLNSNIQSRINIQAALGTDNTGFTTPPNFFDEQASHIQSRIAIEQYVNNEAESFTVPENYFGELDDNIQSRLTIEQYANSGDEVFAVPANYFDELSNNIQSRIAIEELMSSEADGFELPANYFDKLSQSILDKTVNQQDKEEVEETDNVINFQEAVKKKEKGLVRRMFASHTIRYATAACFALILGIGVVFKSATPATTDHAHTYLHEELSTVPVAEIKNYLQLHMDASDTRALMDGSQKVNSQSLDEDLSDYIDTN